MRIIVGQQDQTVSPVHDRFRISCVFRSIHCGCLTGVENVAELGLGKGAPQAWNFSSVTDGIVHAPISKSHVTFQVAAGITIGTPFRVVRLVIGGAAVPTAGSIAKDINPTAVGGRHVVVVIADVIILMLGEAPCARSCSTVSHRMRGGLGSAAGGAPLQVAFRELHLGVFVHREQARQAAFAVVVELHHLVGRHDTAVDAHLVENTVQRVGPVGRHAVVVVAAKGQRLGVVVAEGMRQRSLCHQHAVDVETRLVALHRAGNHVPLVHGRVLVNAHAIVSAVFVLGTDTPDIQAVRAVDDVSSLVDQHARAIVFSLGIHPRAEREAVQVEAFGVGH